MAGFLAGAQRSTDTKNQHEREWKRPKADRSDDN